MSGLKYLILSGLLCYASNQAVFATTCGPVTVNAPSAGGLQTTIENEVCSQINSKFQTNNILPVLSYMAKAYAQTANGRIADYATNMQVFSLGVSSTIATNNIALPTSASEAQAVVSSLNSGGIPNFGVGFSASATLGVSLRHLNFKRRGWFDPKNLNVYASLMVTPTISYQFYSVAMTSVGLYLQYKVLPPKKIRYGLVTWGGVDLGLGYTYSATSLGIASTDKITSISFDTSGQHVDFEPAGSITLKYQTHVIPLEVSTNFSLLYFLSFVVGAATDFHLLSSSEIAASISGPVKINGTATAGDNASFTLAETGRVNAVVFRAFFGPQINIWKMRIFTLVHLSSNQTYGLTMGARFTW